MFYGDVEKILTERTEKGSKYGLERTAALLSDFGNPDKKLKTVHIAGSNGKGSTAAFISSALVASGYKVGTYTSPSVFSYFDKFAFNGKPAPEIMRYYLSEVYTRALEYDDAPSAFEIETVAALTAFAAAGCEYAVVECGLGGREDATNAIAQKQAAVITSISEEHTEVLGGLESICAHKSGIIKNCPAVVSCLQPPAVLEYFKKFLPVFAGGGLKIISRNKEGQCFDYRGGRYFIKLHGDAQCYNAAVAVEVCKLLGLSDCVINAGLVTACVQGRNQIIEKGGATYVLDGAHNPAAFSPLLDLINAQEGEKALVFGCLSDKNVEAAADNLCPHFAAAYVFSPQSYRAMDIEKIRSAFAGKIKTLAVCRDVCEALEKASEYKTIAACGSFTFLKEAKEWIEKRR